MADPGGRRIVRLRPVSDGAYRLTLAGLTAAFMALIALWAILTPMYAAPDEPGHVNSASRFLLGGGWPDPGDGRVAWWINDSNRTATSLPADARPTAAELIDRHPGDSTYVDQLSQHPPLYYLLGAAVLHATGFPDVRWDAAVMALRLMGVVFGAALPFLVASSIHVLTRSRRAALVGAAAVLAVPQLAFIMGSASNDSLTILFASTTIWLSVLVMRTSARWWTYAALAVVLGLLLLTKGTGLPIVLTVAMALVVGARRGTWMQRIGVAVGLLAVAFAVGGWWYARNILRYGAVQPSGLSEVRVEVPWAPGTAPNPLTFLDVAWTDFTVSFWGKFGALLYPLPIALTSLISVACILIIARWSFADRSRRTAGLVLLSVPILIIGPMLANSWRLYGRAQIIGGVQGRYLFLALVALVALVAVGLMAAYRSAEARRRVGIAVALLSLAMAGFGVLRGYIGYYERDQFDVTKLGFADWLLYSPAGPGLTVLIAVLVPIMCVAVTGLLVWILARESRPERVRGRAERSESSLSDRETEKHAHEVVRPDPLPQ